MEDQIYRLRPFLNSLLSSTVLYMLDFIYLFKILFNNTNLTALTYNVRYATGLTILFLVCMWRHHFPKQKSINLCGVLVLSYVRPSKNLTFCNVWARQGSSLFNRVRLNFQVCALRDIKMSDWKRSLAKDELLSKFCLLNSSCSRRSIDFDISEL